MCRNLILFLCSFLLISNAFADRFNASEENNQTGFLMLNSSEGFAGGLDFAPNEEFAPDKIKAKALIASGLKSGVQVLNLNEENHNLSPSESNILNPNLTSSLDTNLFANTAFFNNNFSGGADSIFTPPISLRSLDNGLPVITNFGDADETLNWNLREVKAFFPNIIPMIQRVDNFRYIKYEYIQFTSTKNIDLCLSIGEDGFFVLKNCLDDLNTRKFESVFQLIPMTTDAVQVRSLVLGGAECISTFVNPNLEVWQQIGINKCQLNELDSADISRLWAIAPEIRPSAVILPIN